MSHQLSDLPLRMQRYRMALILFVTAVSGLAVGALLPDLQGFWWTPLLALIVVLLLLWYVAQRGDENLRGEP